MQRVVVIGCSGAGKSVFAQSLGRVSGLKLYHLDELFWKTGGGPSPKEWLKTQEEIIKGQSWIIEGNYGATIDLRLRRADTVIFLDFSTADCFLGLMKRLILSRICLGRRPGVVYGCNERIDGKLMRDSLTFRRKHRQGILKGLMRYADVKVIILRNRREAERFIAEWERSV